MYFEAETQGRILARLHYALKDSGFLFLGKAEMLLTRSALFSPIDLKHRVFTKVARLDGRERIQLITQASTSDGRELAEQPVPLRESAFEASPLAQLVIDANGVLTMANDRARSMFGLASGDIGRPFQDLEVSYRPLELRSRLEEVLREREPQDVAQVERHLSDGSTQHLDIHVAPLLDQAGKPVGTSVSFTDVSPYHQVLLQFERSKQELELSLIHI